MNERILKLLSLCLQAIDKGFDIKLEVMKSMSSDKLISLWHFGLDNGKLFIIANTNKIDEAEDYLKGLIET